MTTKAKRVGHGSPDLTLLRLIEREVELRVDIGVVGEVIDGRGNDTRLDSLDAGDGLKSASSAKEVASHRLSRADVEAVSILAKDLANGDELALVTKGRRGAMDIDVVDV